MTVLAIIGGLILLAILVISIIEIDEYSENKYDYKPFSIKNTCLMIIPPALALSSVFFYDKQLPWQQNLHNLNIIILLILAIISFILIFIRIAISTNFWIALYSSIIQFFAALIIVAFVLLLAIGGSDKKK